MRARLRTGFFVIIANGSPLFSVYVHMKKLQPNLALCLLLDAVGYFTYAIPFLGEFGDLIWAPVSGLIFFKLFGGWKGAMGGLFSFAEEILPFTDFIPTFTIAYLIRKISKYKTVKAVQPIR